jgi:hypothetical protein
MEMAIRRTKEDPRPLEHSLPNADPRACAIVRKLLQKEPSQRYQTATELIRDLDAILLGQQPQVASLPKPDTKRMEPVVSAEGKRKIRFALHWGLLALGVVLAFLSGSLAARGRFLETWVAPDAWLTLRAILLAAGGLAAAGSILVYRRELVYSGRLWTLLLLIPLMLLLGLAAGALLRRPEGAGPVEVLLSSLEMVVAGLAGPSSILCLALLLLSLAAYFSFGRGMGDLAVTASRLAVAASFALVYLFGASRSGLTTPFQNFMSQAELMIPLSTGALLSCFFGAAMLTGNEYGRVTRLIGLVLCAVAMACVYAFVVLAFPGGAGGKTGLLGQPFQGTGRSFLGSGTLLVVVAGIGLIMHCIVTAGMRQHDRFYKKR